MTTHLRFISTLLLTFAGLVLFGQTTGTTSSQTAPAGIPTGPVSVSGVGALSYASLQSMGFSDEEINSILGSMDDAPEDLPATMALDVPAAQEVVPAEPVKVAESPDTSNSTAEAIEEIMDDMAETGKPTASVYGHGFFRNNNTVVYDKVPNAKVSDNYIVGAGDQLAISVYGGVSSYNESFTISEDGYIDVYGIGKIFLKGLTFDNARRLLRQRYSSYINLANSKFDVSLVYSKSIKVNIVGEVFDPGSYNISSINTAFNALAAAGGPNDLGSVRNITVKRAGNVVTTLDIYKFLMDPSATDDTYLSTNDYIVVAPIGKVVEVLGEVKRPFKYELLPEESLEDLFKYAGGLKPTAYTRTIKVNRYSNNENVIIDLNLDSLRLKGSKFELLDGDLITITRIPEIIDNIVTIEGAVRIPGSYELMEGIRISDLIDKAKGLNYEAYTERAYLIRKNEKMNEIYIPFDLQEVMDNPNSAFNFELKQFDKVEVFAKDKFREVFNVQVEGAVNNSGSFSYYDKMTLKDLLYYSGGLKVEAANNHIEVARIVNFNEARSENEPTRVIIESIEIGKSLELTDAAESFQLQPYDIIYVRTTPEFELQKTVVISGEVKYPGNYTLLQKTETIADVIERAGGITQYAYPEGATITRNNISNALLFLKKALDDPESKYNYVMRDGDQVFVPRQGDLVSLSGAIEFPFLMSAEDQKEGQVMVPFDKGKTARFYVKKYGRNFDDDAKRGDTYLVQPNGYVKRTHNFLWFIHCYPRVKVKGTVVVVPYKPEKKEEPETTPAAAPEPFDWNEFMATISAAILSFATIYVLVNNSNRNN
jgi:polysaccharide biosynthesis/export protein